MIIRSWDFKGILKHFTAIEFSVMSLRGSSCCTGHRAWKSAHRSSTCAHTGSPAPAFMGVSLGQELPPLLPSIGSKMQLPASVEAEMDRGLSIAEGWKRRLSGLSVQNYILFNNVSKHKSSKSWKLTFAKPLQWNSLCKLLTWSLIWSLTWSVLAASWCSWEAL